MYDVIIKGGILLDGTGSPPKRADVAIAGDSIVEVGQLSGPGTVEIDAAGCYVTPGFVDIHSHSDYTLLVDGRAVSAISQGVTTEVVGNCGFGCFPIANSHDALQAIYGYDGTVPITWKSMSEYVSLLRTAAPAINVALLVPNGQLRLATRLEGAAGRITRLRLLDELLFAGAVGFSVGLEYPAEIETSEEEMIELCNVVARHDGVFAAHTRVREEDADGAVEEIIRVARATGVRTQISHLAPRSGILETEKCVELVENARAEGLDILFDMHTRAFGFTYLFNALPPWSLAGDVAVATRQLQDHEFRRKIQGDAAPILAGRDWADLVIAANDVLPETSNRSVGDISRDWGCSPQTAIYDILAHSPEKAHSLMVMIPCYTTEQQEYVFASALCMPASDATALNPDGPLASHTFHGAYTWASWYWRFMVQERRLLSPQEAIHRMSGLPAQMAGIPDRGIVATGAKADIAIFDAAEFAARGTVTEPNLLATGMKFVLVNGELVVANSEQTGKRSGRILV